MNPIILAAIGLGLFYISKSKPKKTNEGPIGKDTGTPIFVTNGYEITNCSLCIYKKPIALDRAYAVGVEEAEKFKKAGIGNPFDASKLILFGTCIDDLPSLKKFIKNKEEALFVFDMMKYMCSGINSVVKDNGDFLKFLQQLKNDISTSFDTEEFIVEIVVKN